MQTAVRFDSVLLRSGPYASDSNILWIQSKLKKLNLNGLISYTFGASYQRVTSGSTEQVFGKELSEYLIHLELVISG